MSSSYINLTPTIFLVFYGAIKKNMLLKYDGFNFLLVHEYQKRTKNQSSRMGVMFDGQIKKSEKQIDSYEHHLEVNNQKSD